jgi:ribosomal protein S18 acetylase RimI-like enzyme
MMVSADRDPRRAGTIWMLDLDEPATAVATGVAASFRRAGPEGAAELAEAMHSTAAEILARFAAGRHCYTAWVDDHLAAYGWVSFDDEYVGELRRRLRLLPGEAYVWDCATLPAYRQQHLYSALLVEMAAQLRSEPLCRVWIGADQDNLASQRGMARAGFHHVADLVVSRVVALRQAWVQGQPGVSDSLVAEARRVFLDNRDRVWLSALAPVAGETS